MDRRKIDPPFLPFSPSGPFRRFPILRLLEAWFLAPALLADYLALDPPRLHTSFSPLIPPSG